MRQRSFFDHESRLQSINQLGDPLKWLTTAILWGALAFPARASTREGAQIQRGA